jgi:photosystem II stability/assembly factor-like uncharacterized protein
MIKISTKISIRSFEICISILIFLFFSADNLFPQSDWNFKSTSVSVSLNSVFFTDNNTGYAVGDNGCILKSVNAGENWTQQISGVPYKLNSVFFNTAEEGFISGDYGVILKTSSGGINWTIVNVLNSGERFNSVFFSSAQTGYAAGDNGKFYKTTDSGEYWNNVNLNIYDYFRSVFFVNDLTGWMSSYERIYKTDNGGINWVLQNDYGGGYSLYFLDSLTGWSSGVAGALNTSVLFHTTNGGIYWNPQDSHSGNIFASIYFVNYNKGWNVGGDEIKYTSNGGAFWGTQFSYPEYLNSVFFTDSLRGWVAGNHGTILKTTNGGGGVFSPVELSSFTSETDKNNVTIYWETVSEINNSGFEIQKILKNDLITNQWMIAGFVSGNGNKNTSTYYSFTDKNLLQGNYNYRLKQIDFNGNFEYYELKNPVLISSPPVYSMSQNFPNPFNPNTVIYYQCPVSSKITLKVFDVIGKEVSVLVNQIQNEGYYKVIFNGSNLSAGIYFCSMFSDDKILFTRKMILTK